MDLRKDRAPLVRDFARQIKKVRVVALFDEKEAGAKAVKRQKVSLGLAPNKKLPHPFRVVLFQKNLKKKKDCVLCLFSTLERPGRARSWRTSFIQKKKLILGSRASTVVIFNDNGSKLARGDGIGRPQTMGQIQKRMWCKSWPDNAREANPADLVKEGGFMLGRRDRWNQNLAVVTSSWMVRMLDLCRTYTRCTTMTCPAG
jgi:hypothetical protein